MYTTKHSDLVLLNSHPFILSCFSFQNFKLDDVLFCQGPHLPHERPSYGLGPHSVCASALWGQGHSFLRWLLPTFSSEPGYTALSSSSCSEICHQANGLTWGRGCSWASDTLDPGAILPRRPQQGCADCDLNDRNLFSPSFGG